MVLAIILMGLTILLCFIGCVSPYYRDNWAQRVGMAGVGIVYSARILKVLENDYAAPESVLMYAAVLLFGLGVAWKAWQNRKDPSLQREIARDKALRSGSGRRKTARSA